MVVKDQVKQFTFGVKVRGAYVQQPERARLIGINPHETIFSVDATALYPSIMIFNNISEETLKARVYDAIIVDKTLEILKKAIEAPDRERAQIIEIFQNALRQQFQTFIKREKPAKMKETLEINTEYYTRIFKTIVTNGLSFEDICEPKTDAGYYLLKSYLHPLLEAITWTNPYNNGYNNTVVNYVFFPQNFEATIKHAWVIDDIYSTHTKLIRVTQQELIENYFQEYVLNPYGTLFRMHKDHLASDVRFLKEALSGRKKIKDEMIVLAQLLEFIENNNEAAIQFAELLYNQEYDKITENILIESGMKKAIESKNINDIRRLALELDNNPREAIKLSIFFRNLKQSAAKIFANTSFGIKGLLTFLYAAPVLGNSITTGGKIYGIKVAQYMAATVLDEHKVAP